MQQKSATHIFERESFKHESAVAYDYRFREGCIEVPLQISAETYRNLLERLTLQEGLLEAIAHDMRSPLVTIAAMRDLMEQGMVQKDPAFWKQACTELDLLLERIDILLDGTAVLQLTERAYPIGVLDASSVVYPFPAYLKRYAETRGHSLHILVDEDALISANHKLLSQVLKSIWDSVMKHTVLESNIFTKLSIEAEYAHYEITCDGLHISSELLERIHQGSLFPASQRLGFCFSLARRCVEYQRGIFRVQEQRDKGFRINILIPRFLDQGRGGV